MDPSKDRKVEGKILEPMSVGIRRQARVDSASRRLAYATKHVCGALDRITQA